MPPDNYCVILKGRQGTGQFHVKWWHQIVDTACFPLLFSRGQFGYGTLSFFCMFTYFFLERGLKLDKPSKGTRYHHGQHQRQQHLPHGQRQIKHRTVVLENPDTETLFR